MKLPPQPQLKKKKNQLLWGGAGRVPVETDGTGQ